MNSTVITEIYTDSEIVNKIAAIKALRMATGKGLRECKDVVDLASKSYSGRVLVRLTTAQFGYLVAYTATTDQAPLRGFRAVAMALEPAASTDFDMS